VADVQDDDFVALDSIENEISESANVDAGMPAVPFSERNRDVREAVKEPFLH
jgi:hypothetical protein